MSTIITEDHMLHWHSYQISFLNKIIIIISSSSRSSSSSSNHYKRAKGKDLSRVKML